MVNTTYRINTDNINDVPDKVEEIISKQDRWWLHIPVKIGNDKVIMVKMLADSGADKACINSKWAHTHFKRFILKDKHPTTLGTPNGEVTPEYCLYFSFPTKFGTTLKQKFYLLPDLPAPILANMAMLRAFGYQFRNEVPPIFIHKSRPDEDLEMKELDERFKMNNCDIEQNWKHLHDLTFNNRNQINLIHDFDLFDNIACCDELLYENDNKYDDIDYKYGEEDIPIVNCIENNENKCDLTNDPYYNDDDKDDVPIMPNIMNNIHDFDNHHIKCLEDKLKQKIRNIENQQLENDEISNDNIQFIRMKNSIKATLDEMKAAAELNYNHKLELPDLTYIKKLEEWNPKLYAGL